MNNHFESPDGEAEMPSHQAYRQGLLEREKYYKDLLEPTGFAALTFGIIAVLQTITPGRDFDIAHNATTAGVGAISAGAYSLRRYAQHKLRSIQEDLK